MQLKSRVKNIAVGAAIAMALYASGLLVIFTPLPLLHVSVARSRRDGIIAALVALLAVIGIYAGIVFGLGAETSARIPVPTLDLASYFSPLCLWVIGVGYFTFFVVVAITLSEGVHRRWGLVKWGGAAMGGGFVALSVVAIISIVLGDGTDGIKGYLAQIIAQLVAMNEQASAGANLSFVNAGTEKVVSFVFGIAPSLVFVFTLFTVVMNMLVGRRIIRSGHAFAHIHNVTRFRLPDVTVWAIIAGGIAFFANSYFVHLELLKTIAFNVLIVFGTLYFFQGLAVVAYFLQNIKAPFIKTMAYVAIVFFFQAIGMLIVMLGVADVWADFRLRNWRARHSHRA